MAVPEFAAYLNVYGEKRDEFTLKVAQYAESPVEEIQAQLKAAVQALRAAAVPVAHIIMSQLSDKHADDILITLVRAKKDILSCFPEGWDTALRKNGQYVIDFPYNFSCAISDEDMEKAFAKYEKVVSVVGRIAVEVVEMLYEADVIANLKKVFRQKTRRDAAKS